MKIRVIRNQDNCHAALRELEKFMAANPAPGSARAEELALRARITQAP